jgi:hypothetical protein
VRRLKRIITLTPAERYLLIRVALVVGVARVAIWILPFASARRLVERISPRVDSVPVKTLMWAVTATSRFVPAASCLVQAAAAQALLTRAGYKSRMEIGVRRDDPGGVQAHAWVVCEDQIVIGGATADRFSRLGLGGL